MSSKGVKRKALSLEDKLNVIRKVEDNPSLKRVEVAKQLDMPVTTVNGIMYKKAQLISQLDDKSFNVKRNRSGKYEEMEKHLIVWFKQSAALNLPLNGNILREKAVEIADTLGIKFKASNGWLDRFKKRSGLIYKSIYGEARSGNTLAIEEWKKSILYPIDTDSLEINQNGQYYASCSDIDREHNEDNCVLSGTTPRDQFEKLAHRTDGSETASVPSQDDNNVQIDVNESINTGSRPSSPIAWYYQGDNPVKVEVNEFPNMGSRPTSPNSWYYQGENALKETIMWAAQRLHSSNHADLNNSIQYCTLIKTCADAYVSLKAVKNEMHD